MSSEGEKGEFTEFLIFRLAGQELAVAARHIREIVRLKGATLYPVVDKGAVRFEWEAHGRRVPVVALAPLMEIREKTPGPRCCIVLLSDPEAGFLTDSISRVERIPQARVAERRVKLGDKWRDIVNAPGLISRALQAPYWLGAG